MGAQSGPIARPVRLDVWYPRAASSGCRRATLRDFLYADPVDSYFAEANALIQKWDEDSLRGFASSAGTSFDRIMDLETKACLEAQVPTGQHPLVIYSGGWYNRSPDNIALAEHLASFGYVVAEIPLFGSGLWTGDLTSNPIAIETQERDLEAALGALVAHDWVDRTHVAAMGYSSGGIVALLLGGRSPLIDAVIGLDPSYTSQPQKVLDSPLFRADRVRVPVLTLRAGNERFLGGDRSVVVRALTAADRFTADVGSGSHGDFEDDVLLEAALALARPGEPRTTAEGLTAYRATVSAVTLFLDGVLGGRSAALEALSSPTGGALRMTLTPAGTVRK